MASLSAVSDFPVYVMQSDSDIFFQGGLKEDAVFWHKHYLDVADGYIMYDMATLLDLLDLTKLQVTTAFSFVISSNQTVFAGSLVFPFLWR